MARLTRLSVADVPQHIIQRGNNRQAVFFADEDYAVYLDKLKEYSQKYHVAVHAYILMTNHVHLLLTPTMSTGVAQMMQSLGRYYVRYINQTYRRSGTLWEGRYKSTLIEGERYLLSVSRYIELNPVRAGMVDHPAAYPWSSYHGSAGDKQISMLTPHECYRALGKDETMQREAYRMLFKSRIADRTIDDIRQSTNKGWVLGHDRFKEQIQETLGRRVIPSPRGGDRKSKSFREAQQT